MPVQTNIRSFYKAVKPGAAAAARTSAAKKIQAAWRRRRALKPSRLYSGQKAYRQTRVLANRVLANLSESKFQGTRKDCLETVPKPYGTLRPMSYIFLNTGQNLSASPDTAEFVTPLNLFSFPKGTNGDQRNGEYMYVRHSHLKMEVTCLPSIQSADTLDPSINVPVRCRLMVVKANRKNNKFGVSPAPKDTLFIDTQNGQFGYSETTGSVNLLMKQPINKRKWIVYKDTSFTLTPVVVESVTGTRSDYITPGRGRASYRCAIKLPVYKKTHFENDSNTPDDIDTQWFIILQCVRETHCFQSGTDAIRPASIRMEVLGTTSALDN